MSLSSEVEVYGEHNKPGANFDRFTQYHLVALLNPNYKSPTCGKIILQNYRQEYVSHVFVIRS